MASALPSYTATTVDAPAYSVEASDALPGYSDSGASTLPITFVPAAGIDDKVPNHFKINDKYLKVQVMPSDLQAHLVLLGAFHRLREEVRTVKGVKADIPMEPDDRYAVFLQRAVYRFEQWATRMIGGVDDDEDSASHEPSRRSLGPNEVPPLDVIMVWHTYMLNPRAYFEDCLRKLPGLLRVGSFPLIQLAGSIDQETLLPHPPSESRVSAFSSLTGQPFDPPITTTSEETVPINCPSCSQPNSIPWITYKGDGYGQREFACACAHYQFEFTRETLGVRKFFEDMENCMRDSDKYFLAKGKSRASLEKPFENTRPDLISPSDDVADQTHPSDHFAVAILNPGEANMAQAQVRRRELAQRAKELDKSVEKGKAGQWSELVQKRVAEHTPSFLCPVHYGISDPFGKFGQGDCTALSGGGVQGNFAAGECCKAIGLNGLCVAQFDHGRGGPVDFLRYIALMHDDMEMSEALGISKTTVLGVIGAGPGGGKHKGVYY
ncbi:hypothetical protein FRB90_006634, partial [Tulasnella sp. 427]